MTKKINAALFFAFFIQFLIGFFVKKYGFDDIGYWSFFISILPFFLVPTLMVSVISFMLSVVYGLILKHDPVYKDITRDNVVFGFLIWKELHPNGGE